MNDHDWQQAYNAGKRDAERELVEAITDFLLAFDEGQFVFAYGGTPAHWRAKTEDIETFDTLRAIINVLKNNR